MSHCGYTDPLPIPWALGLYLPPPPPSISKTKTIGAGDHMTTAGLQHKQPPPPPAAHQPCQPLQLFLPANTAVETSWGLFGGGGGQSPEMLLLSWQLAASVNFPPL